MPCSGSRGAFPSAHWSRIDSTNPLERLNREVKRRTDVVGVFPNTDAVIRLVGSVLIEIDDEWQVERHYFSQQSMQSRLQPASGEHSLTAAARLEPAGLDTPAQREQGTGALLDQLDELLARP
jgi:putative transposase